MIIRPSNEQRVSFYVMTGPDGMDTVDVVMNELLQTMLRLLIVLGAISHSEINSR